MNSHPDYQLEKHTEEGKDYSVNRELKESIALRFVESFFIGNLKGYFGNLGFSWNKDLG